MDYLFLLLGLGLLLAGANYLVDSSVAIAQRAKISNFIIGLTIVGMGTSSPELFISVSSALSGSGDLAMGNVIGSNIANIFLILGVTAAIVPFAVEKEQQRRDIPIGIGAALLVMIIANDRLLPGLSENTLSRLDGIVLLLVFIGYIVSVVYNKGKNPVAAVEEADEEATTSLSRLAPWLLWTIAAVSLAALIGGGQLFLTAAKSLAHQWGMSEAVIAITIVAIGTSLPELITAVIAALKKNPQLALGNVIGSCVFNLLMILGVSATVSPMKLLCINLVDFAMMLFGSIMLMVIVFTFGRNRFDRVEGVIFLLIYVAYTVYLLMRGA